MTNPARALDLGSEEKKAVSSLLGWCALFTIGETALTASLVYGLLVAGPNDALEMLGVDPFRVAPVLGLVAALCVTFGGSLWASRRYLSRAISPILSKGDGRRRMSRAELEAQADHFNAFAVNLVVFSLLGYAVWLAIFVGSNQGADLDWIPGAVYGMGCAALLFWLRIKILSPEPLPALRRWPVYQVLAGVASVGAAVWLYTAEQAVMALFAVLSGALMVLLFWMFSNDQGLSRRRGERQSEERTPEGSPAEDEESTAEEERAGRALPGHAIWREHFTGPGEVFIIHGHAQDHRLWLESQLEDWGIRTITLQDEAAAGTYTILELFESYADQCDFGIALLTPDDTVSVRESAEDEPVQQARPNVIFEIGWFLGRKGRQRLCLIKQRETELPSDLSGARALVFDNSLDEIADRLRGTLQIWGLAEPGGPGG